MGFVDADGVAGDLGGGSLELIDIASDRLKQATTLPVGGLRLIDATGNKIEKAQPLIDEAMAQVPWLGARRRAAVLRRRRQLARASPVCTWSRRTTRCA